MSDQISSEQLTNVWQSLTIKEEDVIESSEILGQGAYGTVYAAEYHRCPCVVKKMYSVLSKQAYEQFYKEAKAMKSLNHPCVLAFYGVIFEDNLPKLVMERQWKTLYELITVYHCLHPYFRLSLLRDVACGLSYLHSESMLHRDLTPNNILVTEQCKAKLSDFGQATEFHAHRHMSTCPGNSVYMPPEALKSDQKQKIYTYKLDVFSFGCVLLFTMTGEVPVADDEFETVCDGNFRKLSEAERREKFISKLNSLAQKNVVHACIEDDPSDRPSSADLYSQVEKCMKEVESCQEAQILKKSKFYLLQIYLKLIKMVSDLKKENSNLKQHNSDLTNQLDDIKNLVTDLNAKITDQEKEIAAVTKVFTDARAAYECSEIFEQSSSMHVT